MIQYSYLDVLKIKGFIPLVITQFLGAFNDNVYRIIVSLLLVTETSRGGALSLAAVVFIVPGLIFSGYAGYLADKYSKRKILIITKFLEIMAMLIGAIVFHINYPVLLFIVLFLMSTQTNFFSPAKYGILPEMMPVAALSRANGLYELTTFVAIILGTAAGGILMELFRDQLFIIGLFLIGIAVTGSLFSLGIAKVPPSGSGENFSMNPWFEIYKGWIRLRENTALLLIVIGNSFFWGLGMATQLSLLMLGRQVLGLSDGGTALLNVILGLGIGIGSMFAGWLSRNVIEPGLILYGGIGITIGAVGLGLAAPSMILVYITLVLLGVSAGFYIVPLLALLQHRPQSNEKGRIIATNNFLNSIAMLLASLFIWLLRDKINMDASQLFIIIGVSALVLLIILMTGIPEILNRGLGLFSIKPKSLSR